MLRDREPGLATTPDIMAAALRHGGEAAFTRAVQDDLSASPYPPCLPTRTTVLAYRPEARELVIERELPRNSVIPPEQEYRIVKGTILPVPRKAAEVRHLYAQLLARVALRTVAEAFALTPPALVDSVVLNGRVTAVDHATGQTVHPHLLSVRFGRARFEELNLDTPELDAELCLRRNNALISPHPYDLVPIQPLPDDDPERNGTVAGTDRGQPAGPAHSAAGQVRDPGAAALRSARAPQAWQTQASRDDGIDAVAVNEDPSARRGRRHPGQALQPGRADRGDPGARRGDGRPAARPRGILVTTSWVGRDTHEFARRNGRIQIIEGRELKHLLAETLHLNVLISLPTLPQGWERTQVA